MVGYRVRFIKQLCDDTGHSQKCVQGVVYIARAKSRDRAVQAAKYQFERIKRIPRWDLYADEIELDLDQNVPEGQRR
jgi:hypothetical protein